MSDRDQAPRLGRDEPPQVVLELRLYVNAASPESLLVERNLRALCDEAGLRYTVEIVDVTEDPEAAERDRIVLTPTLIRLTPPEMRVAGDLSDTEAALDGLGLRVWGQLREHHQAPPAGA